MSDLHPPEPFRGELVKLLRGFLELTRALLPPEGVAKLEQVLADENVLVAWVEDSIVVSVDGDPFIAALEYEHAPELVLYMPDQQAAA